MKYLKRLVLIIGLSFLFVNQAQAFELKARITHIFPNSNLESGINTGIEVHIDRLPVYFWLSKDEKRMLRYGGQEAGFLKIIGIGVGVSKTLKILTPSFHVGYYFPSFSYRNSKNEALSMAANERFWPTFQIKYWNWDFAYEIKPALGFSSGVDILIYRTKKWALAFTVNYRYLEFPDHIVAVHKFTPGHWIEHMGILDTSSFNTGIKFGYKF